MDNTVGQTKRKNKSGRVGSFFLGIFIGLLLTLLALGGIGAFAYFKVSPAWINKHFHAGIDLPIDENLTLNQIVNKATGLVKNFDTYTINDLYKDFGLEIKDVQFGINISSLKDEYFGDLGSAIASRAKNISLYELRNLDLVKNLPEKFTDIVGKESSYYIFEGKLYKNADHSQEVNKENDFNYEIITENGTPSLYIVNLERYKVENEKISQDGNNYVALISGMNLPLKEAVKSVTEGISGNISIAELKDYGIDLTAYFEGTDLVKDIGENIKKIKVGKILGLLEEDGSVKSDVTGLMAKIATIEIGNLKSSEINKFTIADIFPESFAETSKKGPINLIPADTTLTQIPTALENAIQTATISKLKEVGVFSEQDFNSGILSLLSEEEQNTCTFAQLPDKLKDYVGNASMGKLSELEIIDMNETFLQNNQIEIDGTLKTLYEVGLKDFFKALSSGKSITPIVG